MSGDGDAWERAAERARAERSDDDDEGSEPDAAGAHEPEPGEASGGDGDSGESAETPSETDVEPEYGVDDSSPPRVLCAGHINWDVTMHVDQLPEGDGEVLIDRLDQSGGGSAANVAVGLVGLDAGAAVYGSVGGDESGALALRELANAGVDPGHVLIDADAPTSVKYLIVDSDGEVMMLANEGANESFSATELEAETLDAADHLHLTSQTPATAAALAAAAGEHGTTTSFDPGRRVGDRDFDAAIASTDVLFCNEREAEAVAETKDIDPWNPEDRVVVIKLGSDGATVRTPSGAVSHPGFTVDAVDTTGAGDAFAAGFLGTLLRDDGVTAAGDASFDPRDYQVPLLVGNACGALAAREVTARVDLSWDLVREVLGDDPEADLVVET